MLAREQLLNRAACASASERIAAEFPAVAELLALASRPAKARAVRSRGWPVPARGELAARAAARRSTTPAPGRGSPTRCDALAGAARRRAGVALRRRRRRSRVERGTPLADVLRAQAADARELAAAELMETAGRREIAMLVPVVFLILPVTVVFALFPGFYGLSLSVS